MDGIVKPGTGFYKSGLYDKVRDPYSLKLVPEIRRHFSAKKPLQVAEFGAGTGTFTRIVMAAGLQFKKYFVVDPDGKMLAAHKNNLQDQPITFEYVKGSAEKSLLPAGCLDAIVAAQCLHWFNLEDSRAEFLRVLKPSARVFLLGRFMAADNKATEEFKALTRFGKRLYGRSNNIEAYSEDTIGIFFGRSIKKVCVCKETYQKNLEEILADVQIRIDSSGDPDLSARGEEILEQAKEFFAGNEKNGVVELIWETFCFAGPMTP
jgi:ubiquinone/menaquinone biosynthesis C-methylase UbiE